MLKRRKGGVRQKVRHKTGRVDSIRSGGSLIHWSDWGVDKPSDNKTTMSRFHKLLHIYTYITLFLTAILFGLIVYYLVFPLKVVEVSNAPFPIMNKAVRAGGTVQHVVNYCKYTDMPSETTKQFINGIIYTTQTVTTDNPKGCNKIIATTVVPLDLSPGIYKLRIVKVYHLNPIRTFTITNDTESFEIIK